MKVVRWVLLMLAVPVVVSCGGSSDASRIGRYSGIWRGTLTEGGRTVTLLIDQRQTGTKTKGYARVIDGDTIHGGILRGQASATGYTASVDFGGTTGTVNFTASGNDASVQMAVTGGGDILRDARGPMANTGVGDSPAGTWTIA
ncbi:MAG TPA: hypothetical protein PLL78_04940 [Fimbriimonadaceae bacterium]|nr:hypothetical protein [Fimbriimonadaceae bacterium]HRJ96010.1 hypothetical protein [Fimbriimonadaceae bacterium]